MLPFFFVTVLDYALHNAINGFKEELGLTLNKRQSRRVGVESLCDLDFADDIVLVSDAVNQNQELLLRAERECKEVGLMLNSKKTKSMFLAEEQSWKGDPSSSD